MIDILMNNLFKDPLRHLCMLQPPSRKPKARPSIRDDEDEDVDEEHHMVRIEKMVSV